MRTSRRARYGTIAGSVVLAMTLIGCSVGSRTNNGGGSLSQSPVSASPSPSPTAAASPSPVETATHTASATPAAPPPPPPPPPPKPGQCHTPGTVGKSQSAKTILGELEHAHTIDEYTVQNDPSILLANPSLHGKQPDVHVPLSVLKAVAAQESGWTSNCLSRDGNNGYGTMQMEQASTDQANDKFQTAYNRMNAEQNILVANEWLEYLTVHFGLIYFHNNFNLLSNRTVTALDGNGQKFQVTLRYAVFAAYNTGVSAVDTPLGIHIGPLGAQYAGDVNALMSPSAPCQKSWGK